MQGPKHNSASQRFESERERMRQRDDEDRQLEKRKRQEARARKKAKAREAEQETDGEEAVVTLGDPGDTVNTDHSDGGSGTECDSANDAGPTPTAKRRRVTAAYRGMADTDTSSAESDQPQQHAAVGKMSVAEQESLALRLLQGP